ncbi:MAG: ATP-binding protein, partial [Gemmatimonadota bacterium]|nr:ATP-binding protein [Gemmatimonadota bacterium]
WTSLAYGDDAELAREVIRQDLASARPVGVSARTWEHTVRIRDGSQRLWSFHAARLGRMSDGRALRLVAAVDVTDMSRMVENERTLRAEAEEANMAKMQFLATMSHELRTPLNAIGGHVQLIELGILGPVTDRQAEALRRVRRAESHLLGLINDVLNFAKIEAGHVTFDLEPTTIGALFEEMDSLIAPQVAAKGLTYSRPTRCDDLRVVADLDKARQVLLNLLSNAVKFTNPGGSITVDCEGKARTVDIHVTDTGVGVASDALVSIFEPFVQVRPDYTATNEGTGLGLAISRDLARAMNGDLSARSVTGEGSTFTLTLPVAD